MEGFPLRFVHYSIYYLQCVCSQAGSLLCQIRTETTTAAFRNFGNLWISLVVVLLGLDPPGDQVVLHGVGQSEEIVPRLK